jgi:hypothetical protein
MLSTYPTHRAEDTSFSSARVDLVDPTEAERAAYPVLRGLHHRLPSQRESRQRLPIGVGHPGTPIVEVLRDAGPFDGFCLTSATSSGMR